MVTILTLGIFWSIYGIFGLFGIHPLPDKYKGKEWTGRYCRCRGISWLLLGVPYIIAYLAIRGTDISVYTRLVIILVISMPALGYTIFYEKKYKVMLNGK